MDWKEGAKWMGILIGAGLISAVIEIVLEERIRGTVRAEARAEVDRVVSAAVERMQAQQLQVKQQQQPLIVESPKQNAYYATIG